MSTCGVKNRTAWIRLLATVAIALPGSQLLREVGAEEAKEGVAVEVARVMFIFDCSASMARPISRGVANVNPPGRPPVRIDVARDALRLILARLVGRRYEVGIMVYGHRAGWAGPNINAIVRRGGIPGPHPNEDVEILLPLGRFTGVEYERVVQRLSMLEPLGETPLYLSILEASEQFPAAPESQRRHIVVITDGLNQQYPDPKRPADKRKTVADVRNRLRSPAAKEIQLDIIGFELAPESPDDKPLLEQLKELAQLTGGKFHSARDQTTIVAALEESLGFNRASRDQPSAELDPQAPRQHGDLRGTRGLVTSPVRPPTLRRRVACRRIRRRGRERLRHHARPGQGAQGCH